MKKFLVMLMVVAMASLLFVGCNGNDVVPDLYTLTMAVNPTGGGTTIPAVGTHPNYTAGTVVSIGAIPATGYEFVNWTGDVDAPNSASATVTMDADKTVTANFEAEVEPIEPTVAPIITSVPDAADGYVNKAEAKDGLVVNGTAPTYSEVKVYINGLTAGTGDTTANGVFQVVVANADLIKAVKTDGAKVLLAKATDIGKPESASSNKIKFILDTAIPAIKKCSAKSGTPAVLDSAVEVSDTSEALMFPPYIPDGIFGIPWFPWLGEYWVIDPSLLVEGTWTLVVKSILDLPPNGLSQFDVITVEVTDPTGVKTPFTFSDPGGGAIFQFIPGVSCVFKAGSINDVGHVATVKVTCAAKAVPGYIDVTFNEPVTGASILAGTWTAFGATTNLAPAVTVRGATKARLTETAPVIPNLVTGVAYSVSCSGPTDLAGNSISSETCTGVVTP